MRIPASLEPLVEMGIIQEVVRPLMSGKEAQLYVVVAGGEQRVAKVYKEATQRSFKQRVEYTEGRKVRSSRDRRAINSRSRYGRSKDEAEWRSAEVDVIYRLREAGIRVPVPYNFYEGVLVMELVAGDDGEPAPRLGDIEFTPAGAREVYDRVIQQVVGMLCAGVVHGDLSEFNVLMSADGPVVIDFPQAVDPARNSSARGLLMRDVENLHRFLERATGQRPRPYAQEMWALFERNELSPETRLGGRFHEKRGPTNTKEVLDLIGDAERDERRRRQAQGQDPAPGRGGRGRRRKRGGNGPSKPAQPAPARGPKVEVLVRSGPGRVQIVGAGPPAPKGAAAAPTADPPTTKRRRRRRRRPSSGSSKPTP